MGHGRCTVKQGDLTRALRAAKKAGNVARVKLEDGKMSTVFPTMIARVNAYATISGAVA
jgi:hypothetical protein